MPAPPNVAAGELIESAWGNAVVGWFPQIARANIAGLGPFNDHVLVQGTEAVYTTNSAGSAIVALLEPTGAHVAVCGPGDISQAVTAHTWGLTTTGFQVFVRDAATGAAVVNTAIRIIWISIGVRP